MVRFVTQNEASHLLHNKFVVILGGSVQRCMYKDLVLLLQQDIFLTPPQLMTKGEASFERDCLVEGGGQGPMSNGAGYREVRQYCTKHHLVRFYFLTRIHSPYTESILEDLRSGLKPDLVFVNSSVGDVSRCGRLPGYRENLHQFFKRLKTVTSDDCLRVWLLTLPLGDERKGGPPVPEVGHPKSAVRSTALEADLRCPQLALAHGLDVLDLHFHFRFSLRHRLLDGVHWDAYAHRWVTALLLFHAAAAWGVKMSPPLPAVVRPTGGPGQSRAGPAEIPANAVRRRPEHVGPAWRPQDRTGPAWRRPQRIGPAWCRADASMCRRVTEAGWRRPRQSAGAHTGRAVVAPPPCWPPHTVMRRRHVSPPWGARVHPYRPAFWRTGPGHPGPWAPGGRQPGPGHPGPWAPGGRQPGPGHPGPWAPGGRQPRPWAPGGRQPGPGQPGPGQPGPWAPGPWAPRPWAPGGRQPGPGQPGPGQPGPWAPGPWAPRPWAPGGRQPGPWHPGPRAPGPWAPGGRW